MEPSLAELEKQVREDPRMRRFFDLAREYQRLGRLDEAAKVCEKGLEHNTAHWQARVLLAQLYLAGDRLEEARGMVERVLMALPENVAANHLAADIYYSQGEMDLALRHYQVVELFEPGREQVLQRITEIKGGSVPPPAEDARGTGHAAASAGQVETAGEESQEPSAPVQDPDEDTAKTLMIETPAGDFAPDDATGDLIDAPAALEDSSDVWDVPDLEEDPLSLESSELSQPDFLEAGGEGEPMPGEPVETDRMETMEDGATEDTEDVAQELVGGADEMEEPEGSLSTMTLAGLYEKQGYPEKAIEIYQRILLKEPDNAPIREKISQLLTGMTDTEQVSPAVREEDVRRAIRKRRIELLEGWLRRIREGAHV